MKKSDFWFITLCALLVIGSVNGWNLALRIATASNAVVVLMDVASKIHGFKADRG